MASEFQRTCPQDRQTGSSIGYCIYDTLFLSLCQGFGGIFGEFNMFAKIPTYFRRLLPERLAAVFLTDGQRAIPHQAHLPLDREFFSHSAFLSEFFKQTPLYWITTGRQAAKTCQQLLAFQFPPCGRRRCSEGRGK